MKGVQTHKFSGTRWVKDLYRIIAVMKIETDIIDSIIASLLEQAAILHRDSKLKLASRQIAS